MSPKNKQGVIILSILQHPKKEPTIDELVWMHPGPGTSQEDVRIGIGVIEEANPITATTDDAGHTFVRLVIQPMQKLYSLTTPSLSINGVSNMKHSRVRHGSKNSRSFHAPHSEGPRGYNSNPPGLTRERSLPPPAG